MKEKKALLTIALAFVVLLGGAYALYDRLGAAAAPDQLMTQEQQTTPADTTAADTTAADTTTDAAETTAPTAEEAAEPDLLPAPNVLFYDAEGNEVQLESFEGKPTVLNFWASWCGPCQMEMPDFEEKYLELGEEVNFVMVNMTGGRETLESAMTFIAEKGYTFPVFYDKHREAAVTYEAYSLPTTYFIDAGGYMVAQAVGAIDAETLQRGIDMISGEEAL